MILWIFLHLVYGILGYFLYVAGLFFWYSFQDRREEKRAIRERRLPPPLPKWQERGK
jgi:hypothetical protein